MNKTKILVALTILTLVFTLGCTKTLESGSMLSYRCVGPNCSVSQTRIRVRTKKVIRPSIYRSYKRPSIYRTYKSFNKDRSIKIRSFRLSPIQIQIRSYSSIFNENLA